MGYTSDSKRALRALRDFSDVQWHTVTLVVFVLYLYYREAGKRRWSTIFGALAFFGMDLINELVNSLILHYTEYSALWTSSVGNTNGVVLVGWNVEIMMLFLVVPLAFLELIRRKDKYAAWIYVPAPLYFAVSVPLAALVCVYSRNSLDYKIHAAGVSAFWVLLGLLNIERESLYIRVRDRWLYALVLSITAVGIELVLNKLGLLLWAWRFWSAECPYPIVVFGYLHFFVAAFIVHDMSRKAHQLFALFAIYSVSAVLLIVYAPIGYI